jgi:AcrR family transcriptional regulator
MAVPAEARPYHHGDLRRALIDAAQRVLEREGPSALSLRAVAREAGVSPAAPYHHFEDKGALLLAVAKEGFDRLKDALSEAKAGAEDPRDQLAAIGVAYVQFAVSNPALYRVMYDCAREEEELPENSSYEDSGFCLVKDTLIEAGIADGASAVDLELAAIAAWCAAHGLAEMSGFRQFEPLRKALGGERQFLEGVLRHLNMFSRVAPTSSR